MHVPHYLAQAEYPSAAVTALEAVTKSTGLVFPLEGLREAAEKTDAEIAEQIEASQELSTAHRPGTAVRRVRRGFRAREPDGRGLGDADR